MKGTFINNYNVRSNSAIYAKTAWVTKAKLFGARIYIFYYYLNAIIPLFKKFASKHFTNNNKMAIIPAHLWK